jgi:hypothetical protein
MCQAASRAQYPRYNLGLLEKEIRRGLAYGTQSLESFSQLSIHRPLQCPFNIFMNRAGTLCQLQPVPFKSHTMTELESVVKRRVLDFSDRRCFEVLDV